MSRDQFNKTTDFENIILKLSFNDLYYLLRILIDLSDLNKTYSLYEKSIDFYQKLKKGAESLLLICLAIKVFSLSGFNNKALKLIERGNMIISTEIQNNRENNMQNNPYYYESLSTFWLTKGLLSVNLSDYDNAIEYTTIGLKLAQENCIKELIPEFYHSYGLINDYLGKFDEALDFYYQSIELKKEFNNRVSVCKTLLNVGVIYELKDDLSKALEVYEEVLDNTRKSDINQTIYESRVLMNIAGIYHKMSDYDQSLHFYSQAESLAQSLKKAF